MIMRLKNSGKKITKIAVISDTHIPICLPSLPALLIDKLKTVDLIVHAGDFVNLKTFRDLERIAPVYAVSGNMDDYRIKKILPLKREIKILNFKILHLRMRKEFVKPDIIIFGHSHKPFKEVIDGVLMFNPGSATENFFTDINSFGLLEVDREIKVEHIEI